VSRHVTVLPDDLVNLIAAGEVVERPASVVKELVENALDAGAARVLVRLADGGRRLVAVADDGAGMSRDDALMALERHATSKIAAVGDLAALSTYGFRGEALPSIAAVGSFTLESWDGREAAGTRILLEQGRIASVTDAGLPRGTAVKLAGIFSRVPARRKFLRSRETELAVALQVVEEAALARPDVFFEVAGEEGTLLTLPPVATLRDRVYSLWGNETGKALLPLNAREGEMQVAGFISPPSLTWTRRDRHHVLVNGRPVRDPLLNRVISSVLAHRYPAGRFPALVLALTLPPGEVDVNVHPAKREVRFARLSLLQELLEKAVRALGREEESLTSPAAGPSQAWLSPPATPELPAAPAGSPTSVPPVAPAQTALAGMAPPSSAPRVIGQLLSTYILAERGGELVLVDQHAAHERIWFNRLLAARSPGARPSQRLLLPSLCELSAAEKRNLFERADLLFSFGFEFEEFGGNAVRILAVPADLRPEAVSALVREIAADLSGVSSLPEDVALAVARRACHASVRAGRALGAGEMSALITELAGAEAGFACPHGRPTAVALSRADLERLFSRR
jgi:DNA mismatch repair protein MutL